MISGISDRKSIHYLLRKGEQVVLNTAAQMVTDFYSLNQPLLIYNYFTLDPFKGVSLGRHTLLPTFLPLLEVSPKGLF